MVCNSEKYAIFGITCAENYDLLLHKSFNTSNDPMRFIVSLFDSFTVKLICRLWLSSSHKLYKWMKNIYHHKLLVEQIKVSDAQVMSGQQAGQTKHSNKIQEIQLKVLQKSCNTEGGVVLNILPYTPEMTSEVKSVYSKVKNDDDNKWVHNGSSVT